MRDAVGGVKKEPKAEYESGEALKNGTRAICRWSADTVFFRVQVVAHRLLTGSPPPSPHAYEYYIHHLDVDSRLDRWVKLEDLVVEDDCMSTKKKYNGKAPRGKMANSQKRKKEGTSERFFWLEFFFHKLIFDFRSGKREMSYILYQLMNNHNLEIKMIETIEIGQYEMDTWYFSPFPEDYMKCKKLFYCEFCLKYMKKKEKLQQHKTQCSSKYPPGHEI